MSAKAFYEPKLLSEFVGEFLGSRDMSRPLSDQERIKVFTRLNLQAYHVNVDMIGNSLSL